MKIIFIILCKINIFHIIFMNILSFMYFYDTSLLKVHYFYDNNNLCYINTISNSNGDLYFEYFGNNNDVRYLYGLNSTTGKEILFNNNKILQIKFNYMSTYHESIIINYDNNENYIFTYNPEYCELINMNTISYSSKLSENFIFSNTYKKASYRNKIIKLVDNNYLLSIIGKTILGSYLYISIFNFQSDKISGFKKLKTNEIALDFLNTTQCFQTEKKYIECLYNANRINTILSINPFSINIYDLNLNIKNSEYFAGIDPNSPAIIIHIKKEIGAYI